MKYLKTTIISILLFCALIAIYLFSMIGVFSLPSGNIQEHLATAEIVLDNEGDYPKPLYAIDASIMDNYTDRIMLTSTVEIDEMNTLFNAMSVRGYARYWHGYITFLRPLLILFDYLTIRKIVAGVHILLFTVSICMIQKRFGFRASIPFGITWFAFMSMLAAASLQYFVSYALMFLGVILLCYFYKEHTKRSFLIYFFLVMGSLINFLDLLTFPLVTLAVPITIVALIDILEKKQKTLHTLLDIILSSVVWAGSYALTWFSKWWLAGILIKSKVLSNALEQASYRMYGNESFVINRKNVLIYNINTPLILKWFIFSILPWIILALLVFIQKKWKTILQLLPLALIFAMPYVWFEVLCNHSQQHRFFAYRAQIGSLFTMLLFFSYSIFPFKAKWRELLPCKKSKEHFSESEHS